jgi:hypothetical protein
VSSSHLTLTTRFLLLSGSCRFVDVGCSLWRENESAVYNCCCWYVLLVDSYSRFSGASYLMWGWVYFLYSAGPRQRSLSQVLVPWDSWRYFTVSDLRLPFSSLLRLVRSRWRYSNPPLTASLILCGKWSLPSDGPRHCWHGCVTRVTIFHPRFVVNVIRIFQNIVQWHAFVNTVTNFEALKSKKCLDTVNGRWLIAEISVSVIYLEFIHYMFWIFCNYSKFLKICATILCEQYYFHITDQLHIAQSLWG